MAHHPGVLHQYKRLGSTLCQHTRFDFRLRELAILLVGKRAGCRYEYVHHMAIAKQVGVRDQQIEQLADWCDAAPFDQRERAALAYSESLALDARAAAGVFQSLTRFLDQQELVELTATIAYHAMAVRFLNGLEVELEGTEQDWPAAAVVRRAARLAS